MANKNLIRRMRQLLILVLILAMTMSFATMTAMAFDDSAQGNTVTIPVNKTWDDNDDAEEKRPESITVSLYRYSGDNFDITTAGNTDKIGETTLSEDGGWESSFVVSKEDLLNGEDPYKLHVVEANVDNYSQTACTNPVVTVTTDPFSIELGEVYTPCDSLEIPTGANVVILVKGQNRVVWSANDLTPQEVTSIVEYVADKDSRFKGYAPKFYVGEDTFTFVEENSHKTNTFTVNGGKITFGNKNDWNYIGTATYSPEKSKLVVSEAAITNSYNSGNEEQGPAPAKLTLTATKTLNGVEPGENDVFSFVLKEVKTEGETVVETEVETVENKNDAISFSELTFTEADTFTYTISEVNGTDTNINYDETVYTVEVKVTVSDDGSKLDATPTYKDAAGEVQKVVFANTTKESDNGGGNSNNGGGNFGGGGTVTPLPPDENLEIPETPVEPDTPSEPVDPSDKPLPEDKHTETEVPKTGDVGADALMLNLLLLSISALAGTAFYLRRKASGR